MKRNQLTAGLLAVLLFLGGAAAGALGHRFYSVTTVNAAKTPESDRHRYLTEMQSRLNLTPAQVTQLETIMHSTKGKYKAVRDSYQPQMLQIKQDHLERVKAILTAEQVPKYEKLVAEREQRAHEQEEHDRSGHATH